MNKLILILALFTTTLATAAEPLHYNCKDAKFVEYEVEQLAEEAKDIQFDQKTRTQIFDEYYYMLGQRELLRKQCSIVTNEFELNGVIYMVVEESNSMY